jgi:hypothetical protein
LLYIYQIWREKKKHGSNYCDESITRSSSSASIQQSEEIGAESQVHQISRERRYLQDENGSSKGAPRLHATRKHVDVFLELRQESREHTVTPSSIGRHLDPKSRKPNPIAEGNGSRLFHITAAGRWRQSLANGCDKSILGFHEHHLQ